MVDCGSTVGLACGTPVRPPAAVATATVTSVAPIAVCAAAPNMWNNLVLSSPATQAPVMRPPSSRRSTQIRTGHDAITLTLLQALGHCSFGEQSQCLLRS
jgi:hypothetical protein